jgi:hypothetical protein
VSTQPQVPARAQRLYGLWSKLSEAPMTEREFLAEILKALDRGVGAEADASAYRHLLVGAEAVIATRNGSGEVVYTKAPEFPSWPENGPGTAAYDAQLKEMAAREQGEFDRAAEEVRRNSPANRHREELVGLFRQLMREDPVVRNVLVALVREEFRQHSDQRELRERMRARLDGQQDGAA